ncbi:unnamed protein product [Adineta steineri]|uniref:G-protein coupled receptors family 1 profile domain-containing protein n=1 Tax=Adineta steineri TaxID=433720 RepID=A0A815BZH8_9BILA|nr:unnamed protein product [Adineta steineri]CAF1280172.1 unnamed protein product [Adineta steineri]
MSSSIIASIQSDLTLYGYSITMVFGNIGNIFVVIILSRQRENACSIYLLSAAVVNIIYLTFYGFIQIFPVNYRNVTTTAFVLCKIYLYIAGILGQLAKTLLVLASIDRFLVTNRHALVRGYSTPKRAKYLVFFGFIFWLLLSIHLPIMTTIVNGQCTGVGIYVTIRAIYVLIFVGLLPPIMLSIFGFLTYRNMRQLHNRIRPTANNADTPMQRRDRDLLKLVISETVVYLITAGPYPLMFLETMISQYVVQNKSIQYSQIEVFMLNIVTFILFINSAAPFYTYIIASKSFRHDFTRIIINGYRKIIRLFV